MAVSEDTVTEKIRFFCLNLRFGLSDDGPDNWSYRKHCYPDLLEKYPCDFYGFQEANDFQITYLQTLLADHKMIGQRYRAPRHWQNNIIFHHRRWKCLASEHFYLSHTPDLPSKFKESQWPRQCTIGTFQKGGVKLTVVNTHFDFKAEIQRRSAVLILKRLDRIAPKGSVVLMGDLNAGPDASCLAVLMGRSAGFINAVHPPARGTHHAFKGVPQGPPIDWILYRGDLERHDAAVVTDAFEGRYPSDHFPLTATLKYCRSGTKQAVE